MSKLTISIMAAVAANGVIGRDNDMPWHLREDLRRFKAMTMGKPMVLGRKNFDSFGGRVLPGRPHIVITRNAALTHDDPSVHFVSSFDAAIEKAKALALEAGGDEIMIVGGGEIYRLGMAIADILHITHVEAEVEGDVIFPQIDPQVWVGAEEGRAGVDERNDYPCRFVTYRRR